MTGAYLSRVVDGEVVKGAALGSAVVLEGARVVRQDVDRSPPCDS